MHVWKHKKNLMDKEYAKGSQNCRCLVSDAILCVIFCIALPFYIVILLFIVITMYELHLTKLSCAVKLSRFWWTWEFWKLFRSFGRTSEYLWKCSFDFAVFAGHLVWIGYFIPVLVYRNYVFSPHGKLHIKMESCTEFITGKRVIIVLKLCLHFAVQVQTRYMTTVVLTVFGHRRIADLLDECFKSHLFS